MGFLAPKSALSVCSLLFALVGVCSAGSDAPRGVALGFVFDPEAKCDPPCEHGGVCIRNNTCFCSKGYEGERCQYGEIIWTGQKNMTCSGGCWNGGECTAVNGVAKCICPSGWTGSECQYPICPQGCRNGGTCMAPGICSCPEGWLGGACHTAVCSQTCLNGGKCISPNKCRCRPPFSGPRCEERKKSH
uniref:Schwann cell-specific EGF-like repeat autocrine factor n=1 Tax=Cyprinodon variegatus TaxID=28743 RepID=A0A3Q2DST6_CYPVA